MEAVCGRVGFSAAIGHAAQRPAGAKLPGPVTRRAANPMDFLNFLLNLAGLLLWLNWRSMGFVARAMASSASLLGTLKRTQSAAASRWPLLAGLVALLLFRSVFYWQIGSAMRWTPQLSLEVLTIPFRTEFLGLDLLFSWFSFGLSLAAFYLWLVLLSLANRRVSDTDPLQRLVRLHLGWIEPWPIPAKLLLPPLVAALLWLLVAPVFSRLNLVPPASTVGVTFQKGLIIGAAAFRSWEFLIVGLLLLHLLISYVYLGNSKLLTFVEGTARNLLTPLRRFPLRVGKADFAPITGIALVLIAAESGSRLLSRLYQKLPP